MDSRSDSPFDFIAIAYVFDNAKNSDLILDFIVHGKTFWKSLLVIRITQ